MYQPPYVDAPESSSWHVVSGSIVLGVGGIGLLAALSWLFST
jgi:hypothetical protein